jgi:hypothetical protein
MHLASLRGIIKSTSGKEVGTGRVVPPYEFEHQHYRELLGQKGLAEAWHRLIQKTCQRVEGDGCANLDDSELTVETLYALVEEAQANVRTATSKLDAYTSASKRSH